ncbi:glycoside hydrolase family 140 protein [Dinghuibacter silviterrae]|uniref:Collagenase-like protein with putative collagen-binding domain n=1 Tax=Dinghuibacter silviterrae TaxID=1539049 RepID=A0A4R8DSX4_9BACT|nr:glycoside hydrolase family 140 protein [Dinghuibacter silviterrae]TDX01382.1 collagenase-like protein with putative collagen-binding domain [Dinghuibacter silviterrae]
MLQVLLIGLSACWLRLAPPDAALLRAGVPLLRVAPGGHYLETPDGAPFFWLGDTGWLLLTKLKHEDALRYLDERKRQGYNVVQVMVLHGLRDKDAYGHAALVDGDLARPDTAGAASGPASVAPAGALDAAAPSTAGPAADGSFWSNLDFLVAAAADRGIYLALVPLWGNNIKAGHVTPAQATAYARFLGARYAGSPNVIWMNGGDIRGADAPGVWNALGNTLHGYGHLVTFHPRGRHSSSDWFADQPWLDFNSVQSGHRRYEQDTSAGDPHFGEDNWRYIQADYDRSPAKPVLDAEPSYEGIPQGLHDTHQPRWKAADIRRYAYWSVFAGACGFTYGNNSVMQFHEATEKTGAYGATDPWEKAVGDPGATQMQYLKELMLSRGYFERVPDTGMVVQTRGAATAEGAAAAHTSTAAPRGDARYDYIAATRGRAYAFLYTYTGKPFRARLGRIEGNYISAAWFNPRDGRRTAIGSFPNRGERTFDPPGAPAPGNDWVLMLDGKKTL